MFVASHMTQLHTNFGIRSSHRSLMRISRAEVPRNSFDASCRRRVCPSPPPTQKTRSHPNGASSLKVLRFCVATSDLQARETQSSEVPWTCMLHAPHAMCPPEKGKHTHPPGGSMHPESLVQMPRTVLLPDAKNLDTGRGEDTQKLPAYPPSINLRNTEKTQMLKHMIFFIFGSELGLGHTNQAPSDVIGAR